MAYQIHAPKGDQEGCSTAPPLETRPIRVYPHLYRTHIKIRFVQMKAWQEQIVHPAVHGSRWGHECQEAYLDLVLQQDLARVRGAHVHGYLIDNAKFFDMYIPKIIKRICLKAGLDEDFVGLMSNMWQKQKIYTKLAGHFAQTPDTPSNSLAQGCSFSLVATNLHTSIWMYFVCTLIGGLKTSGFIDDVNMQHQCEKAINAALKLTIDFNSDTGHQINLGKSAAFSTNESARNRLRKMIVPVNIATRCLGQQHRCTKAKSRVVQDRAIQKYMKTVDRIACLPVNRERKILL